MSNQQIDNTKFRQDVLLAKFQQMTEADFTKIVLIPLFKAMGYSKVDYNGGVNEGGKDLICWREGDFGNPELTVVQVKKTKPSSSASSTRSFSEIVTQLQQAKEKYVPYLGGGNFLPGLVYFVTPFEITNRVLQSRIEGLENLRNRGVSVIDGPKVAEQIILKLPKLADELCGTDFVILDCFGGAISNEDLLSALNYGKEKNIADIYCDLDFGVGKINTKFFFSLSLQPKTLTQQIDAIKWTFFEETIEIAENLLGVHVVSPTAPEICKAYEESFSKWIAPKNQNLIKRLSVLSVEVSSIFDSLVDDCEQMVQDAFEDEVISYMSTTNIKHSDSKHSSGSTIAVELRNAIGNVKSSPLNWGELVTIKDFSNFETTIANLNDCFSFLRSEQEVINAIDERKLTRVIKDFGSLKANFQKIKILAADRIDEPRYEFNIEGQLIADAINLKRDWMATEIKALRSTVKRSRLEIRNFFAACHQLFEGVEIILAERAIAEAIGFSSSQKFHSDPTMERINLPIREVFQTGINCAVFGDAGAGKSTTLRMYAEQAPAEDGNDAITLYLPLTRVLAPVIGLNDETSSPLDKFERGLSCYVQQQGKDITQTDLISFLKAKRRVTFVFDGVDEVIKGAPWILEAIEQIGDSYQNSQIILSSRMSGEYISRIKYLSLTLLPFTDEQAADFVEGWFKEDIDKASTVKAHLKETPAIAEIVRSPLLATILCVLAENSVPLPRSELSMYDERLKLLLGHYDIHKKTNRVKSHHSLLELVARKLAFQLHQKTIRSAHSADLQRMACKQVAQSHHGYSNDAIKTAVRELIDPCNILVPMTMDGQFGFGHLRYQEYLAARELKDNRGIGLQSLLTSGWWRAVVVLFARMTDDIKNILEDVIEKQQRIDDYFDTLYEVIETRPSQEQPQLFDLLQKYSALDKFDEDLADFHDFDSSRGEWGKPDW
jgi:hypothetical protein